MQNIDSQQLAQQVAALPPAQVKAAMLRWLGTGAPSISTLEDALDDSQLDELYATEDFKQLFPSMTEEEMVESSIQALAESERDGTFYTHEEVKAKFGIK